MGNVSHSSEGSLAVSVTEAAVILSVHERTIWRRIKDGTLPSFKFGKLVRIQKKALDRIMEGKGNDRLESTG